MVSIRYFWGVGEFCRMKSSPRGNSTSSKDAPTALVAAISTMARMALGNRLRMPQAPVISGNNALTRLRAGAVSEEKLQRELNQAGVRSRSRTGDYAEVCIVGLATGCVRGSELRAIE